MPIVRVEHPEIAALRNHGMSLLEAHLTYRESGGACAICGDNTVVLVVDHDHSHCRRANGCRKCIRGLLCPSCNSRVGRIEQNYGFDPEPYFAYIAAHSRAISGNGIPAHTG